MAIHVIQGALFGNSYLQIGQVVDLESTSIAHEGHSLVFTGKAELFRFFSDFSFK